MPVVENVLVRYFRDILHFAFCILHFWDFGEGRGGKGLREGKGS